MKNSAVPSDGEVKLILSYSMTVIGKEAECNQLKEKMLEGNRSSTVLL